MPVKNVFLDVETTGLYPTKHGIVQIGAYIEIDGAIKEIFNEFIKPFPSDKVEPSALAVNNLKVEDFVKPNFITPLEAKERFCELLGKYVDRFNKSDKYQFIGYNSHTFDMQHMRAWFRKCGDKYFGSWFWNPSIDVMLIVAFILRNERHKLPNFKLNTVCKRLGLAWDETKAHDALYDIDMTRAAYHVLQEKLLKGV